MIFLSTDVDHRKAKKELRQQILAARKALNKETVSNKSQLISTYLDTIPVLAEARVVMGYVPFRNEVDIFPWLLKRWEDGIKVLLPRIVPAAEDLLAVELVPDQEMLTNKLGLSEPLGAEVDPATIDAVIVPGVVFDRQGYRLGYGKGYYDRFLPRLKPGIFICGVAFELQVVDQVPHEVHDYQLSYLTTETGVYQWK